MISPAEFSYGGGSGSSPEDWLPYVPITLRLNNKQIVTRGLVDSGSAVNVLPYEAGRNLGFVWQDQNMPLRLTGNLAGYESRAVFLDGEIENIPPVRLAFAWTIDPNVPLILGQANFFFEFDVCFFRSQQKFQIRPRSK